jgi:transcriptional regulator with XRE-family HTH domain
MTNDLMGVGDRIRQRRIRSKLTQEQLARQLDVSVSTLSRWERDEFCPSIEYRAGLAAAIGGRPGDYKRPDAA